MKSSIQKFSLVVISLLIIGCNDTNDKSFQQQAMLSVLYAQTATEHKITNTQTFLQASNNLENALKNKNWTAALEQGDSYQEKPPAIILDVDETVLDNSIFQARSILNGTSYPTGWIDWGMEENAPPVPGVKDFLQKAKKMGIKIFYVTNRVYELEEATLNNLLKEGLPIDSLDDLLMKGENNWGSDKTSRRELIAKDYRILMMFGDQISDFTPLKESSVEIELRHNLVEKYASFWGSKWYMLANPMYGKWEGALYNNVYPDNAEDATKLRLENLIN